MKSIPIFNLPQNEAPPTHRPIWELTPDEFSEFQISPLCKVADVVWALPLTTPGSRTTRCRLNWGMELHDGSRLTDARHERRLTWAKKLMALILCAPVNGKVPASASLNHFGQGFKWLISWMAMRGIHDPDELDVHAYIQDLPRFIVDSNHDEEISISQGNRALAILAFLWSERRLLEKWGVLTLTENPFRDYGSNHFAQLIATKAKGWIPPLPDEVAVPLFNQVAWWLGQPAEDVIRLLEIVDDPLAGEEVEISTAMSKRRLRKDANGLSHQARRKRADRFFAEFSFGVVPGDSQPWHAALSEDTEIDPENRTRVEVRILFDTVREACALCIQGYSGLRISELMGIEEGFDLSSGLPKGVRIEDSATGLYNVYVIRTVLSKTEEGLPREMDWVLGLSPKGSPQEPLPVRALRLLNRLHAPWRAKATTNQLILAGGVGAVLPTKFFALGPMKSESMLNAMKRFIARWVDLSNLPDESKHKIRDNDLVPWRESKGAIFKSHMLRKSWAQFMFAVDPRLMPAIQLQFHHLSIAMTDTGYIGNNLLLVTDMDSVATQARNQMILEVLMGRNPLAGKMGEQLEQATRALTDQVKDMPTSDAYNVVVDYCEHAQLPIFFSPHGICMPVQTHEMRCQDEVSAPLLLRKQPNARTRQPSLCAGCGCFVLDARHAGFWASRYMDNWLAYKRAERSGDVSGYKVIKERAKQAGKLLKKIGVNVVQLDSQIDRTLEGEHGPE